MYILVSSLGRHDTLSHLGGGFQLENAHTVSRRHSSNTFSWLILIDVEGPDLLCTVPSLGWWCCMV